MGIRPTTGLHRRQAPRVTLGLVALAAAADTSTLQCRMTIPSGPCGHSDNLIDCRLIMSYGRTLLRPDKDALLPLADFFARASSSGERRLPAPARLLSSQVPSLTPSSPLSSKDCPTERIRHHRGPAHFSYRRRLRVTRRTHRPPPVLSRRPPTSIPRPEMTHEYVTRAVQSGRLGQVPLAPTLPRRGLPVQLLPSFREPFRTIIRPSFIGTIHVPIVTDRGRQ